MIPRKAQPTIAMADSADAAIAKADSADGAKALGAGGQFAAVVLLRCCLPPTRRHWARHIGRKLASVTSYVATRELEKDGVEALCRIQRGKSFEQRQRCWKDAPWWHAS